MPSFCCARLFFCVPLFFVLLSQAACPGRSGPSGLGVPGSGERPVSALIQQAGSEAALVLVLRPQHFAASVTARATLANVLDGELLPPEVRPILPRLLQLKTPLDVVDQVAQIATSERRAAPPTPSALDGWDADRPFVAALFEPTCHDLGTVGRALFFTEPATAPTTLIRHRLLVPARDPAVLARTLHARFIALGLPPLAQPDLPDTFAAPGWALAVFPGADHVRIELVVSERDKTLVRLRQAPPTAALPEGGSAKPRPPLPVPTLTPLLAMLRRPVVFAAPPNTPAQHQLIYGDDFAAVQLRLSRLRDLSLTLTTDLMLSLLLEVEPDRVGSLSLRGWVESALSYRLLSAEGILVEDLAFTLSPDLHLGAVLSLTPTGVDVWTAARAAATDPLPTDTVASFFQLRSSLDLRTLIQRTPAPTHLAGRDLIQDVHDCGTFCRSFALLSTQLGWLKYVISDSILGQALKLNFVVANLPGALSVSATELTQGMPPVRGTLVATYPKDHAIAVLQQLLSDRLRNEYDEGAAVQVASRSTATATLLSFGPPSSAAPLPLPPATFFEATLDLNRLRNLPQLSRERRFQARLQPLSAVRARGNLTGSALSIELAIDRAGEPATDFHLPLGNAPTTWTSSWRVPQTAGQRCIHDALDSLRKSLSGGGFSNSDDHSAQFQRALTAAQPALQCAAAQPDTAEHAAAIRQAIERLLHPSPPRPEAR